MQNYRKDGSRRCSKTGSAEGGAVVFIYGAWYDGCRKTWSEGHRNLRERLSTRAQFQNLPSVFDIARRLGILYCILRISAAWTWGVELYDIKVEEDGRYSYIIE